MARLGFLKFARLLKVQHTLLSHGVRWLFNRRKHETGPAALRELLEQLGGTYIKFGQVLSLQPDALPLAYCNALFDLLDRVPPFAYKHVEQTFLEDLGTWRKSKAKRWR